MKKFKLNVQRHICILLCLILYITVLPLPVSAEEAKSKTVRVGWYEGTYNTTGPDGQRRGYSYEYQQAVAAHTGWKYEYVEGSWAELMSMLKKAWKWNVPLYRKCLPADRSVHFSAYSSVLPSFPPHIHIFTGQTQNNLEKVK